MAKLPKYFHFCVLDGKAEIGIQDVSDHDFVEVVRCKDCTMANADSDERYMYCTKCHEYKPIDYFCAEGRHADD